MNTKYDFMCVYVVFMYYIRIYVYMCEFVRPLYRVSQEECARLRESVPYVKVYRL